MVTHLDGKIGQAIVKSLYHNLKIREQCDCKLHEKFVASLSTLRVHWDRRLQMILDDDLCHVVCECYSSITAWICSPVGALRYYFAHTTTSTDREVSGKGQYHVAWIPTFSLFDPAQKRDKNFQLKAERNDLRY